MNLEMRKVLVSMDEVRAQVGYIRVSGEQLKNDKLRTAIEYAERFAKDAQLGQCFLLRPGERRFVYYSFPAHDFDGEMATIVLGMTETSKEAMAQS